MRRHPRKLRTCLRRALRIATPQIALRRWADLEEAIWSVTEDPSIFPDVSVRIVQGLRDLDPTSASGNEFLRLRYLLTQHGFIAAGACARQMARASAMANAMSPGASIGAVALAASLAVDSGELDLAREHMRRYRSQTNDGTALGAVPSFVEIASQPDKFKERANLRRGENDDVMLALVRGRTVAVVGPAPSNARQGAEIDAHDVVVRFSYTGPTGVGPIESCGERTTIAYYRFPRGIMRRALGVDSDNRLILPADIECAVTEWSPNDWTSRPVRLGFRPEAPGVFGLRPIKYQKVQYAVYDLLHFEPQRIKIFNSTFYLSSKLYQDGFVSPRVHDAGAIQLCGQFARHDAIGNRNFVQNVLLPGGVDADDECVQILNLSDSEYVQGLDELFGAGSWAHSQQGS